MIKFAFSIAILISVNLNAAVPKANMNLPVDLTQIEYEKLWQNYLIKNINFEIDPETEAAIKGGEKLSLWIKAINESRNPNDHIRLTSPSTRRGIPIESPNIYGPIQIKETLTGLYEGLPSVIKDVVYGEQPVSSTLPTDKDTFISWGRKVNRLYQTAVRWQTTIKPLLSYYKARKAIDVRGFYHLKKMADLDLKLEDYLNLDRDEKIIIRKWMVNLCLNNRRSIDTCERHFRNMMNSGQLISYKENYWKVASENWDSFFKITQPRTDIEWKGSAPNLMRVSFIDPKNERITSWLKENIEDEFKLDDWALEMTFLNRGTEETASLEFKPNTTPHVKEGNVIVMDANAPIEEYEVKWTIRHEYGHILRLPDCYVEFYDEEIESVVNYQLDTTDLMCSRAGNFNQRIFDELKRVYYKEEQ